MWGQEGKEVGVGGGCLGSMYDGEESQRQEATGQPARGTV